MYTERGLGCKTLAQQRLALHAVERQSPMKEALLIKSLLVLMQRSPKPRVISITQRIGERAVDPVDMAIRVRQGIDHVVFAGTAEN